MLTKVTSTALRRGQQTGSRVACPQNRRGFSELCHHCKIKSVDAVVIATCNHWHAPIAILACAAGKHVYVEKPCSHNPHEGEQMVEAARKHKRVVQMGNQRRSWPQMIETMERIRNGSAIGRAYYAQCWYTNSRLSIGKGKEMAPPADLDYALWQGPAPHRPFHSNYLHYNWHWFWNWGNGELGNNGVHFLDLCRWGLGVDFPTAVTSTGGRLRYSDDQETPDTNVGTWQFGGNKSIAWEGYSCTKLPVGRFPDILFHGEKGTLAISGDNYTIYDLKGKQVEAIKGTGKDEAHLDNFFDAVRGSAKPNSEIEEGHKTTMLCPPGQHRLSHANAAAAVAIPPVAASSTTNRPWACGSAKYEPGWESEHHRGSCDLGPWRASSVSRGSSHKQFALLLVNDRSEPPTLVGGVFASSSHSWEASQFEVPRLCKLLTALARSSFIAYSSLQ